MSAASSNVYDCIIVGGSYAGLSAAMALGRSFKKTLVIDAGKPCNRNTPHSHNFIGSDGVAPSFILEKARQELGRYTSVSFYSGEAITAGKETNGFFVKTSEGNVLKTKKIILAGGIRDLLPEIKGFDACWGISVLHCPFCHGYEVAGKPTFIYAAGEVAFHMCMLISNWTKQITLILYDASGLLPEQKQIIIKNGIEVMEDNIAALHHHKGMLVSLELKSGKTIKGTVMYARPAFEQNGSIASDLNCEVLDSGHLKCDEMQRSNAPGVFVAGDNSSPMRSVSQSVAAGTRAGAAVVFELNGEAFV